MNLNLNLLFRRHNDIPTWICWWCEDEASIWRDHDIAGIVHAEHSREDVSCHKVGDADWLRATRGAGGTRYWVGDIACDMVLKLA